MFGIRNANLLLGRSSPPIQETRYRESSQHDKATGLRNRSTSDHICPARLVVVIQQKSQVGNVHGAIIVEVAIGPDHSGLAVIIQKQSQVRDVHREVLVGIARKDRGFGDGGECQARWFL
jgi:hypothetical protein